MSTATRRELQRRRKELQLEREEIMGELQATRKSLYCAKQRFEQAVHPEMIDACVFEINALQARYSYYLKMARELSEPQG